MRNKWGLLLFVVLLASSVGFSQAVDKKKVSTEFYIKVKEKSFSATQSISSNVTISSELPFLRRLSNSNVQEAKRPFYSFKEYGINRVYRVSFSGESDIEAIYEQLKKDPSVELVERVYPRTIISTPNDSLYSSQWYLPKIKAPQAWDITVPAGEVIVAIVDNAFQVNHPDLAANMVAGRDVSDGDNDPSPPNTDFSHGTHVAGIVSAVTNNTIGISAAANNRVKIMPIKATPNRGDYRGIYHGFEGIAWAIVKGAKIISLSWGGSGFSQVEQDIINFAHANNILVIAAAGNNNNEGLYYPASYEHVISVASVDSLDKKSSFSSFGSKVDISAPGSSILSTLPYGNYFSYSGTSMATPLVASVCGYILSAYPTTLPNEMENLVKRTANDISSLNPSYLDMLGAGRVNMLSALACKSMLLDTLKLIASDTRVCPGDTITLTASIPDLSYNWYKDGVVISGDSLQQLSVNEKGRYAVKIKSGDCELKSEPLNITINNFSTPAATVNYIENLYCEDSTAVQKLVVQTEICELSGPNTYTYSGPMVGYDGGTSNGENLSVEVSRLDGGLSTLIVEIVWEKKDLYTSDNCDEPSGPNSAFYDEVSFKLRSPSGEIQAMIPANTYMSNLTSQGVLTTKFMIGGTALNILPYSGTFQPAGDFTKFMGEDPNGIWTLIADDDSFIDPLCVKGFSVTIETDAVDGPPVVSWWSAASGGSLFGTGSDFSPSTSTLGEQAVYVSAKCEGGCESERIKAKHYVKPRPYITAFAINEVFEDEFVADVFVENVYTDSVLTGFKLKNTSDSTEISTYSSLKSQESPVTICEKTCFVVRAEACPSDSVSWSFGLVGETRIVCTTGGTVITANCLSSLDCPPISSNTMAFKDGLQGLALDRRLAASTEESFYGNTISSSQFISTLSQVNYTAEQSIVLLPGFEFSGNKNFKATIGGCP